MTISQRLHSIQEAIRQAEVDAHRKPGSVQLLAVSKGREAAEIQQAFYAGQRHFGENYLQEARRKMQMLVTLPICWHFIGPTQSNKAKEIAKCFTWVHSVDRQTIAQQLNDARPASLGPLQVCIQVNLDHETTKSGIAPIQLPDLAAYILQFPNLKLRGLMCIPRRLSDQAQQFATFSQLTNLLHTLNMQLDLKMDVLSMGMSNDLYSAINAGSTMVRIGQAIFGERKSMQIVI
jgi:pyridoxal phosphate enzyme (YggS family)